MSSDKENFDPLFYRLSGQTRNALLRADIRRVEDLASMTPEELKEIQEIGTKRKEEIIEMLETLNLSPGSDLQPTMDEDGEFISGDMKSFLDTIKEKTRHWSRGVEYLKENRVVNMQKQNGTTKFDVQGTEIYQVELEVSGMNWDCTCPSHSYWGPCKHVISSALYMAERTRLKNLKEKKLDESRLYRLIEKLDENETRKKAREDHTIHYLLLKDREGNWRIIAYMGPRNLEEPISELPRLQYENIESPTLPGDGIDRVILERLSLDYQRSNVLKNPNSPSPMGDVLPLLRDKNFWIKADDGHQDPLTVAESELRFQISLRTREKPHPSTKQLSRNLQINVSLTSGDTTLSPDEIKVISEFPLWVLKDDTLYRVRGNRNIATILTEFPSSSLQVGRNNIDEFCQKIFPKLQNLGVRLDLDDGFDRAEADPVGHVFLQEKNQQLLIEYRPAYRGVTVPSEAGDKIIIPPEDTPSGENGDPGSSDQFELIQRDQEQEQTLKEQLLDSGLRPAKMMGSDNHTYTPEGDPIEWLMDGLNDLTGADFDIFGQNNLNEYERPMAPSETKISVSSGIDWFDLKGRIKYEEEEISLAELREAIQNRQRYIKLSDGRRGEIPEEWIEQFSGVLGMGKEKGDDIRMPSASVPVLDRLLEKADTPDTDETFQKIREQFKDFEEISDVEPPEEFQGELRPYQKAGLSWMLFLRDYGFGGILADDMGLGKTVQILALFQKIKEMEGDFPSSLVVAPRSVIKNWKREANKFVPTLPVYLHHGSGRIKGEDEWPPLNGLTVTTYATMRRDINWLKNIEFDYAVLDESQAIRNPQTQTSRAVRLLTAENKVCLSGTPVQNTTMDLWSQFEFLNPGFLGPKSRFQDTIVRRIERDNSEEASRWLRQMVDPFLMRRTKNRVEKDLPPLTESTLDCPMGPEQQRIYDKIRRTYRTALKQDMENKSKNELRFKTLEGLTRLRQVCCHPDLVGQNSAESAKLIRFRNLAREIIQEDHRILVFSQFVQFLNKIQGVVEDEGWAYEYLDGQTKNRQKRVEHFQSNEDIPLFLISLKAGGEGLNLTGADYVLLMDPWWNPAVEKQATDRTHRIGQDSRVFVYRLLCPDTIEEKILELQEQKLEMAQDVIQPEAGLFKKLEREDIESLFEK